MLRFLIHRPKWITVAVGILVFWLAQTEWLTDSKLWQKGEGALIDRRYLLRGPLPAHPDILLVGLGTTSFQLDALAPEEIAASPVLQKMQQPWPWDRSIYAAILEKLMAAGAKVVLFDFVFASETEGDEAFAQALEKYQDRVVIGQMLADEPGVAGNTKKLTTPNPRLLRPGNESICGLVNIRSDRDDIVRRARYRTSLERERLDAGGLDPGIVAALEQGIHSGAIPDGLTHIAALAAEKFRGSIVTPSPEREAFISFQGGGGHYRARPVENLFVENIWKNPPFDNGRAFSNKVVIVGPMAEIFHDVHPTPFGETPGPEILAQMLAGLLRGEWLTETSAQTNYWLALGCVALALLICLGIPQALLKGLALVGVTVVFVGGCQLAFTHYRLVVPMMPALFGLTCTGLFGIIFEYAMEQLERRRYRNVLDRYVSKNVARAILADRRSFENAFKGRKQPVTVLFSDIRNFTAITEQADADKLVAQLNEYFLEMVGGVLQHEGTLQKFIGDAIMAVWGDTHSAGAAADARGAVTAALQMRHALAKLNADWRDRPDRVEFSIGIGVNHGEVIVGNVGHPQRMEFTVLGDGVNLTARLESATRQFYTDILIGEETEKLTREHFIYRHVGAIAFKGKTQPVETFFVLSAASQPPPTWLATHHEAIRLYRAKQFAAAAACFQTVQQEIGVPDHLCGLYLAQCETLTRNPPPENWDGAFTLSEK